ncbi:MAG: hypothetical protein IK137_04230 [Bacilli bacterium]|nr:hypothetical protein [Bacilli bacterium]
MLNFTKEEMRAYVEGKLPYSTIIEAKKKGNTIAEPGLVGEEVITYTIENGQEKIERTQKVTLDSETNRPGWILTKTDSNNQPVIDSFGHLNQYIVADSVFQKTYEPSNDGPNLYSKSQVEKFIQAEEDLHFFTKYGEMEVAKGGYIKVTDLDRISGISAQDFADTYVIAEPQKTDENGYAK